LLEAIGSYGKPVYLSTGASTWDEVIRATCALLDGGATEITRLHCVLAYPTPLAEAHLGEIKKGGLEGYSDHTMFNLDVLTTAWFLGATVIEKHFTDSTDRDGPDHPFSMTATMWREMVDRTRELEASLGDGRKKIEENERETAALDMLKTWDGRMEANQIAPLIFTAWLRDLNRILFAERLGGVFADYWDLHPDVVAGILTKHPEWCSDPARPGATDCAARLTESLRNALDQLTTSFGSDISNSKISSVRSDNSVSGTRSFQPRFVSYIAMAPLKNIFRSARKVISSSPANDSTANCFHASSMSRFMRLGHHQSDNPLHTFCRFLLHQVVRACSAPDETNTDRSTSPDCCIRSACLRTIRLHRAPVPACASLPSRRAAGTHSVWLRTSNHRVPSGARGSRYQSVHRAFCFQKIK